MRVLFMHNNFPAQYRHLAAALAADPGNRVVFATRREEGRLPGVAKRLYRPARAVRAETHPYLRPMESAVLNGQAVYRLATALKAEGFVPDVICAHSGWGPGLYVREAFPDSRLLGYFEWYYAPHGSDADFIDPSAIGPDEACRIRSRNAPILLDLAECDRGVSPTGFQRDRFPPQWREKLTVLHDGINTDFFQPAPPGAPRPGLRLPGLDLSGAAEIVTYATRGMEPYRGFPQFMRAAAALLRRRPGLHVVISGQDRAVYGQPPKGGGTWREAMLAELPEMGGERVHFTGLLPYAQYREVLRASAAHVYLTVPFVLSWSLLEAMATGCAIIASDTAPVREVMTDGEEGRLVGFFDSDALAACIETVLDDRQAAAALGAQARRRVLRDYRLRDLLPRHLALIADLAGGG